MLIYIQIQTWAGFLLGAMIMLSFHNMFVSMILYKARQTNVSNMLKIIFNFGFIVRNVGILGLYMTPKLPTYPMCFALQEVTMVGNVIVRLSLSAFLLWRLRQIRNVHNYGSDKWISIILFTIKVALAIPYLIFQRTHIDYVPEVDASICNIITPTPLPYAVGGIATEFLIDLFVTFRLVQILISANKNAAQVSTTNIKSKRSLFTAVMYWNFLRLFVSFIFHFQAILDIAQIESEVPSFTAKIIVTITLSYVITVDAEIVRVIEGKDKRKGSSGGSAGTEKSLKSIHSPRYNNSDLPKYSQHAQTSSTHSQIENDKIAVVSMKRLSFFEWANVVVGKRLRRDNVEEEEYEDNEEDNEYDDEDMEEIIDGPSKSSKDNDLEKDLSQDRRSSNFSGTTSVTETSTLDENPDIVIH
ncbi:uncharacterized protein OCT59_026724 [Rhizophagus irregularis]|uniref:G-protein coupled receptors family 1 profile domain-containing protein n=4 Tax=Rhizophagus irregularis TaxID=588596 RepID=U9SQ52_RHIID|nr:hypothetical protein GLOIN_2v1602591 [Rhizophagus irregularis DAOM 181602=DAOM 197198]EXX74715.1 hypothetical protein RirG_048500 [Rhizophagus irregularis DAOM 197198w]UZO06399.1 hypothetical protein OCT59_026724 [Rhizophagus irregularis]POG71786.1 hypothetical protein GLOIN_2v1602591 [Rhizophagus irregularis DAOM 181602=DAOM 197198]CAB4496000.1 unnamed protein product [Rhizophagus irregularis]GBC16429.2 hypothetical protein GLOIN_2v1602591 [Rhizophagus irregularis DAOM 181602=DAOM 197198]|eukprot:XP_025178652.1 hypothetical protein GLOIN_2v1602591 [Rhizophagus irregularis DAOM 181602=DAOM 197198]